MANSVSGAGAKSGAFAPRRQESGTIGSFSKSRTITSFTNINCRSPDAIFEANGAAAVLVAVIDGPYDATALSGILARAPVSLGNNGSCSVNPQNACNHGTFVMGLLGAREDASIPGLCPNCEPANLAYPVCCQYDESVIICRSGLPRLSNNASRFSAGFSR